MKMVSVQNVQCVIDMACALLGLCVVNCLHGTLCIWMVFLAVSCRNDVNIGKGLQNLEMVQCRSLSTLFSFFKAFWCWYLDVFTTVQYKALLSHPMLRSGDVFLED